MVTSKYIRKLSKKGIQNLSKEELLEWINICEENEKTIQYNKARRSWIKSKKEAEETYEIIIKTETYDVTYLYEQMKLIFPEKNDCASLDDLEETLSELKHFGIKSKQDVLTFLEKHKDWLIEVDQEEMDERHHKLYREELGDEVYFDSINNRYWFCYPAFIRNALEKEFGDKYEKFANICDGI